jgi:hypothetical protein
MLILHRRPLMQMTLDVNLTEKIMADLAEQLNKLRAALQMGGEHNEGISGGKGDVFGSGDIYESVTWPKNAEIVDDEGEGLIKYSYDGRVRHKHYIATVETATDDNNFPGVIVAKYTISRKGTVFIANDIQFQPSQQRDVGNSIVARIRSVDGVTV